MTNLSRLNSAAGQALGLPEAGERSGVFGNRAKALKSDSDMSISDYEVLAILSEARTGCSALAS